MKIGVLSNYSLATLDNGGKIRIFNISSSLSRLGNEIFLLMPHSFPKKKSPSNTVQYRCYPYYPGRLGIILKPIIQLITGKNFFSSSKVDIIIAEHAWTVLPAIIISKLLKIPVVLDNHNLEYLRSKRMSKKGRSIYSFIIEFKLSKYLDGIFFVSKNEAKIYKNLSKQSDKIMVVPNSINLPCFNERDKKEAKKRICNRLRLNLKVKFIVFHGDLTYEPNILALENILKISLEIKNPNVKFLLIGKIEETYKEKLQKSKNIICLGYVRELKSFLLASDFAIAPLITGGGTNLKILEYLSYGLPLITTKIGAEGFNNIKNLKDVKIIPVKNFVSSIHHFMEKYPPFFISKDSFFFVEHNTWMKAGRKMMRSLGDILANP